MSLTIKTTRTEPTMGAQMILHIKEHHLARAKQVLAVNVQAGRFPATGFSTFIGPNASGTPLSERKPGKTIAAPKGTTVRWYDAPHELNAKAYSDAFDWLVRKLRAGR